MISYRLRKHNLKNELMGSCIHFLESSFDSVHTNHFKCWFTGNFSTLFYRGNLFCLGVYNHTYIPQTELI